MDATLDLQIASYLRKTSVEEIRQRRKNYLQYQMDQKQKMIQFLTSTIADPLKPLVTSVGQVVAAKFSVFQNGALVNNGVEPMQDLMLTGEDVQFYARQAHFSPFDKHDANFVPLAQEEEE